MKNWIENSCVLVTGAYSGIGREICKILLEKYNCKLICVARNKESLNKFKEELTNIYKKPDQVLTLSADVSKKEDWQKIHDFATKQDVNIIINNAGTMLPFLKISNVTEEDLDRIFKTNFYSIFYSIKTFNDYFEKKKSASCGFVNITSASSLCLIPGQGVYSASKSAATKLSLVLSSEAKKKYFVGTYLPGFTNTNIFYSKDNSKSVLSGEKTIKIVKKLSAKPTSVAKRIVKSIIHKKRYKRFGKDTKLLKILYVLLKEKSSDFLLKIFKKSKNENFEDLFN